jgi:hypothetical protein
MKKILSIIALLAITVMSYAQNITFATTYNIIGTTSLVSGNTYTVIGNVTDFNGIYNGTSVAVGDSLFYMEDGIIYAGAVTLINSTSGNQVSFRFLSTDALLSTSPSATMSGQIIISRKNPQGYCAVPAGTNEGLRWSLENRFKKLLASDIINSKIYGSFKNPINAALFTPINGIWETSIDNEMGQVEGTLIRRKN